jgi:murein L,D-transpeptidase YafK
MGRLFLCVISSVIILRPAFSVKEDAVRKAFAAFSGRYVIYVSKQDFSLEVYDRTMSPVARYLIAYGSNPDGKPKLYRDDNRTPEGVYYVKEILSMDADRRSPPFLKLRDMNRIYFRAAQGHHKFGSPAIDLGKNAYGPRYFGLSYPNAADKKRYRRALARGMIPRINGTIPGIGYGIAIHGNNDEPGVGHRSSSGCIRMYNRDIIECGRYIRLGTPVIIAPE